MAITLRESTTATGLSGNDPVATLTSVQEGDVIVAIGSVSFADLGAPVGYTELDGRDDGGSVSINVSYLVVGASPPSTVTFPGSGNGEDSAALIVYVLAGVDTTTPIDVTRTIGTTADPPAITPVTDGAWVIGCATANESNTSITGNDGSNILTVNAETGAEFFNCSAAASTYEVDPAATTDPSAFTFNNANQDFSCTIALRPEGGTPQQIQIGLAWY